jgi:hypothetical protein
MENNSQSRDFPKKRRGRPRVFNPEMEAILRGSFSDKTQRGIQNKFYLLRAFRLVQNDPALKWLYDKEAETIKSVILSELGRITSDTDLLNMAREICNLKPRTRDAVLLIRAFRKSEKTLAPTVSERPVRLSDPPEPEHSQEEEKKPIEATPGVIQEEKVQSPAEENESGTGFTIWGYDETPPKL